MMRTTVALLLALSAHASAEVQTATGVVFHDQNENGVRDPGEGGVQDVLVSNGRDVVRTAPDGSYQLQVDDDTILFVCKPTGWRVPLNENNLPQHYYLHKPEGSPDLEFGGVAPTGPLPESVDFPLLPQDEPERFNVILFGDPQPYTIDQVDLFKNDILPEVIDFVEAEGAAFGATLGDIVGDDLDLFMPLNDVIASVGIPWLNVYGNHDMDFDAAGDEHADETFNRVYGPTTYAYAYGGMHFVVMDNVIYQGPTEERPKGRYRAGLSQDDRAFLDSYAQAVHVRASTIASRDGVEIRTAELRPTDNPVVLFAHIPMVEFEGFRDTLGPIADLSRLSVGAHWHRNQNYMLVHEHDDHPHDHDHHHVVSGTTSGSWWQGQPDEFGIPHTMMRDGKPNGWTILTIDPDLPRGYEMRYKAARRPWSDQLHIHAPDSVSASSDEERPGVTVNLYSGYELSMVEVRFVHAQTGNATGWRVMETTIGVDPFWQALKDLEAEGKSPRLPSGNAQTTLWIADLPEHLETGAYTIEVRETNMYGHEHHARRVIRVED